MRRSVRPFLAAALTLFLGSQAALAHPHVWAVMNTDIAFNAEGKVVGLAIEWTFDDLYAQDALGPFQQQEDGSYASSDLEALTRENVESLADYEYFTLFRQNGQKLALGKVDAGLAKNIWKDGRLSLMLFLPLAEPADPRNGTVSVRVYDPEYYVAIDYDSEAPFHVTGAPPQGCNVSLSAPITNADLEEKRAYLSTKGKDWKPDDSQQFGEYFAQSLEVACGS